jgi:hypothetical protein
MTTSLKSWDLTAPVDAAYSLTAAMIGIILAVLSADLNSVCKSKKQLEGHQCPFQLARNRADEVIGLREYAMDR